MLTREELIHAQAPVVHGVQSLTVTPACSSVTTQSSASIIASSHYLGCQAFHIEQRPLGANSIIVIGFRISEVTDMVSNEEMTVGVKVP